MTPVEIPAGWLSIAEASARLRELGVERTPQHVAYLCKRHMLNAMLVRLGNRSQWFIEPASVDAFAAAPPRRGPKLAKR